MELIPVNARVKDVAVASLTRGVRGVFVSCAKLALFRRLHLGHVPRLRRAFRVHLHARVGRHRHPPLLASWSVSLPAALGLLAKGEGLKGAALVVLHWVTLIFVDIDIYQSEIQVVHPYIVGLSVVGGMCVFDPALQGAVLGPLLVTALATGYNLYQELMRTPPAGIKRGAGRKRRGDRARTSPRREDARCLFRGGGGGGDITVTSPVVGTGRSRRDFGGWDPSTRR